MKRLIPIIILRKLRDGQDVRLACRDQGRPHRQILLRLRRGFDCIPINVEMPLNRRS